MAVLGLVSASNSLNVNLSLFTYRSFEFISLAIREDFLLDLAVFFERNSRMAISEKKVKDKRKDS